MSALTLPLIIVHGKFTNLYDMNDDELEAFVSFLVKCDKASQCGVKEPPWWLTNLPFVHPIKRPNKVTRKWRHKLEMLIKKCYKYYDYELLIELSGELAIEQAKNNIKFISKCSHLTSVYNKTKLIVTIRNENIIYDLDESGGHNMLKEHNLLLKSTKLNRRCYSCNILSNNLPEVLPKRRGTYFTKPTAPNIQEPSTQTDFLQYFELTSKENSSSTFIVDPKPSVYSRIHFSKAPYIPFSSQLGRRLAAKVKYFVQDETHLKRLERISRYINASPVPSTSNTPPSEKNQPIITHTPRSNRWEHTYKFPGKTYKSHLNNYSKSTCFLASTCKPCYVKLTPVENEKETIDLTIESQNPQEEKQCPLVKIEDLGSNEDLYSTPGKVVAGVPKTLLVVLDDNGSNLTGISKTGRQKVGRPKEKKHKTKVKRKLKKRKCAQAYQNKQKELRSRRSLSRLNQVNQNRRKK